MTRRQFVIQWVRWVRAQAIMRRLESDLPGMTAPYRFGVGPVIVVV